MPLVPKTTNSQRFFILIAAAAASLVACSAGSPGPGVADSSVIDPMDASAYASDARAADAGEASTRLPPSPAGACEPVLAARGGCAIVVGANPPIIGGTPPDGVYDRTKIFSMFPQRDTSCGSAEISFNQGTVQITFHDLGGPFVSGGAVAFNPAQNTMKVDVACGDPLGQTEYSYSYNPTQGTFTLFYGTASKTAWVYKKR